MVAQFPPELFDSILYLLRGGSMSYFSQEEQAYRHEPPLKLSKREFGACSLVCRYWAQHLRPEIFRNLTLRSRDDVLALFALAESTFWPMDSGFRVGMYVLYLKLEQDIYSLPWTHLILHYLPQHLLPHLGDFEGSRKNITITLTSTGDSEDSKLGDADSLKRCAPLSIYHGLPRRFPLTYAVLHELCIINTTFRSFNDFISLVSGITLRYLECNSVRLLDTELLDVHIPPMILHTKPRQVPGYVTVRNCGPAWPFVWTVTTTRFPSNQFSRRGHIPAIYVVPSELVNMAALIKCLFDDCRCILCSHQRSTDTDAEGGASTFEVNRPSLQQPSVKRDLKIIKHTVSYDYVHAMFVTLSPEGFVTALVLELFNPGKNHEIDLFSRPRVLNIDWHAIDALASQFTTDARSPWKLEIGVQTDSVDDMRAFAPYVRSQMPLMQTTGRLAFKFGRYGNIGQWTPWTEELEHVEGSENDTDKETGSM